MSVLKKYRKSLKMTQKQFSERYNIPIRTLCYWEKHNKTYTHLNVQPGDEFGKLKVIKRVDGKIKDIPYFECKCECGNTSIVYASHLTKGRTKSCGCVQKEVLKSGVHLGRVDGTALSTMNNKISKSNTSGIKGVYFKKDSGKWCAQICLRKKQYYLGVFDSKTAAADARRAAEKQYFEPILNEHGMILKPQEIDQDMLNDDTHRRRPFYDFGKGNDK